MSEVIVKGQCNWFSIKICDIIIAIQNLENDLKAISIEILK